jgi:hypothetical protein
MSLKCCKGIMKVRSTQELTNMINSGVTEDGHTFSPEHLAGQYAAWEGAAMEEEPGFKGNATDEIELQLHLAYGNGARFHFNQATEIAHEFLSLFRQGLWIDLTHDDS